MAAMKPPNVEGLAAPRIDRLVGKAGERQHAPERGGDEVGRLPLGARPGAAERRERHLHEARVRRRRGRAWSSPSPARRPGRSGLDDEVGPLGQSPVVGATLIGLEVHVDAPLARRRTTSRAARRGLATSGERIAGPLLPRPTRATEAPHSARSFVANRPLSSVRSMTLKPSSGPVIAFGGTSGTPSSHRDRDFDLSRPGTTTEVEGLPHPLSLDHICDVGRREVRMSREVGVRICKHSAVFPSHSCVHGEVLSQHRHEIDRVQAVVRDSEAQNPAALGRGMDRIVDRRPLVADRLDREQGPVGLPEPGDPAVGRGMHDLVDPERVAEGGPVDTVDAGDPAGTGVAQHVAEEQADRPKAEDGDVDPTRVRQLLDGVQDAREGLQEDRHLGSEVRVVTDQQISVTDDLLGDRVATTRPAHDTIAGSDGLDDGSRGRGRRPRASGSPACRTPPTSPTIPAARSCLGTTADRSRRCHRRWSGARPGHPQADQGSAPSISQRTNRSGASSLCAQISQPPCSQPAVRGDARDHVVQSNSTFPGPRRCAVLRTPKSTTSRTWPGRELDSTAEVAETVTSTLPHVQLDWSQDQIDGEAVPGEFSAFTTRSGSEAIPAEPCGLHPRPGNAYRCLHDVIAKGIPLRELMAELFGRFTGTSKGKGGPMHLSDPNSGLMATTGIVGEGIPIAKGLALAASCKALGK